MTYTARFAIPSPEEIGKRIPVYDRPGPRYTSYPTAPVFSEEFGEADFKRALGRCRSATLSLYIHIPFCERLCSFCACNRTITRDHSVATAYLDALDREVDLAAAVIGGSPRAVQLAIGGGTPTFLSPEELARLCQIVDSRFPAADSAERSIEVDPRVTTREQLEVLAERGFNRISLGVQDFATPVQEAIRRVQSREETEAVAVAARELGMGSVNFDLIYGLPFQTVESFCETVDQVIRIRPDRIALYSYAHVTWISKQQRGFEKKDLPEPERKVAILLAATERFEKAGYRFLGLDHFAVPEDPLAVAAETGDLRRNFMGYTTQAGVDLIAFGASGISETADAYAQSLRDTSEWQGRLEEGHLATMRGWWLSDDDKRRKWLIQRLMCQGEVNAALYRSTFEEELSDRIPELQKALAPFVEDGLMTVDQEIYRVEPLGRVFLRVLAMTFDAYLPGQEGGRPMFSRTV
ncbi:MAG: oxygen-independent coproporphyrinogen III oxidase [Myxococcota bacterium]